MSSEESESLYAEDVDIVGHQDCSLNPDELRKIEAWLEPTDYLNDSSEFNRHIASRAPGTGLWICDTPQYQQWHNTGGQGSFWVKGVPGAGKSVISASLVQHLKATEKAPVLSFFFHHILESNRIENHEISFVIGWRNSYNIVLISRWP